MKTNELKITTTTKLNYLNLKNTPCQLGLKTHTHTKRNTVK